VIHTRRTRPRGFTLIELMVALLVSSLLVGMILAIFSRMSLAYRGQQQIAGVQQILAAARAAIELDAKQAGLGMPQGFRTAMTGATQQQSPVQVINSSTAPDQVAFFYADPSSQALVDPTTNPLDKTTIIVVDPIPALPPNTPFLVGDLVVLTTSSTAAHPPPGTSPDIATYDACVLKIASINAGARRYTFETAAPWGSGTEDHCSAPIPNRTMMYRFIAHAYRIDPTPAKLSLGVLDRSVTGNLLGNAEVWDELAYGFSDLQTAVRIYDPAGATDLDGDGDIHYNWYSGANQNDATRLGPAQLPAGSTVLGMSISLLARTDRNVEGIATRTTPDLIAPPSADNNPIGDRASITLPAAPPNDLLMPGQRIYRHTTFQVDFRNLGVGLAP
jgi:prepilin-type N-terminal cleavage/methylation domain-containing protein